MTTTKPSCLAAACEVRKEMEFKFEPADKLEKEKSYMFSRKHVWLAFSKHVF